MTDYKHEDNEEIGHYGQTLISLILTVIPAVLMMQLNLQC